jgi:predicted helicase
MKLLETTGVKIAGFDESAFTRSAYVFYSKGYCPTATPRYTMTSKKAKLSTSRRHFMLDGLIPFCMEKKFTE